MIKTFKEVYNIKTLNSKTLDIKEITFEFEKLYSMVIRIKEDNFKLKIICLMLLLVLILTLCLLIFS